MSRFLFANILMNVLLAGFFVALNTWALANRLEETFISLALFYGMTTTVLNALFIGLLKR